MRTLRPIRKRRREAGIALLIAIFVLLLISVVAIALIVSSSTESALAGNYRSSTGVYYAALAGVEEARARMRPNDPNSFKNTWAAFYPAPGASLPIGTVGYVLNPSPIDNAGAMFAAYPDTEYDGEFGPGALGAANVQTTQSVWNRNPLSGLPFAGPLYKWVRINAISEKSLNLDVDADGQADSLTPLYYDSANRVFSNNPGAGSQALEFTALAVLPNGSQKLLQYLVAPTVVTLPPFRAALTLSDSPGNNATYHAPAGNAAFVVRGNNQDCSGNPAPGSVAAIGVLIGQDATTGSTVLSGIQPAAKTNYTGWTNTAPDVEDLTGSPANLQPPTPSQLNAIVQAIQQNADATIPQGSPGQQKNFLNQLAMSPSNILTLVANGDLDLSGWGGTGYGLLLVTGNLYYDPSTTWNGIILVIGNGFMSNNDKHLNGQLNGAVYVANTMAGPNLGGAIVSFSDDMDGLGIRYSSCWIQASQPISGYRILSFHEVSQ